VGIVTELTQTREFRTGIACGGIAAVVLGAAVLGCRRRVAFVGLGFAIGAWIALHGWGPARAALVPSSTATAGFVLIAVAGVVIQIMKIPPVVAAVCLAPGAAFLATDLAGLRPGWVGAATGICCALGGAAAIDADRWSRRNGFGIVALAVTAVGIYSTVPDTEGARALVGVALPLLVLVLLRPVPVLGDAGTAVSIAIVLHTVAREGHYRPGAVVGGLGCLGVFACEPLGRALLRRTMQAQHLVLAPTGRWRALAMAIVLHTALVVWAARVAGLRRETAPALALLLPGIAVGAVLGAALPAPRRHPRRITPSPSAATTNI
jgi:hypothetical protein